MIAPAWRWVRSLVFVVQMYLAMALLALVFTPWAILDRAGVRPPGPAILRRPGKTPLILSPDERPALGDLVSPTH